ncbi:MAG: transporter substrate-binding domain-containing protein [Bacteroidetes bacterium]|nr:transporter substrate-binding domain-containing protein [Bacteroidota bacterium]
MKDFFLFLVTVIIFQATCYRQYPDSFSGKQVKPGELADLYQVKKTGKLTALVDNSSTSYFIYKGEPMGFEYELLSRFARYLNVHLEIIVVKNMDSILDFLDNGTGDIIAANFTVTSDRQRAVEFSNPVIITRQVLVQKKPDGWKDMRPEHLEKSLLRKQIDLGSKEVWVRKNSSFYTRLVSLSDEIGNPVKIIRAPGEYDTEMLIKMVAMGEIPYTVADENVAMVNSTYYPQIDIKTALSFPQKIAWAVRKTSPDLLREVNMWIAMERKKIMFSALYNRYFIDPKWITERKESPYFSPMSGRISQYDHIARIFSRNIGWDWRLLVALMYQESRFDPAARSWAGAFGIMQLMPSTAEMFGVDSFSTTAQHVSAGTKYLARLNEYWEPVIPDSGQRIKFVLASYNVGIGHVIDSRNLAIKYNLDPNSWDGNVEECILWKSNPKYYNDTVVRYGYCRGEEPYNYVREVLTRYERYKQILVNL